MHAWNQEFVAPSPEGRRYEALAAEIDRALRFMAACGIDLDAELQLHQVDFCTSHEALLLGYEEALTRARQPHRRLVRLLGPPAVDRRAHPSARRRARGVPLAASSNPIGVKLGPDGHARGGRRALRAAQPRPRAGPARAVHPDGRRPGRRRAAAAAARGAADAATRSCGRATRCTATRSARQRLQDPRFDDVIRELHGFFAACDGADVWPGGVHIELTGENVTECLGGSHEVLDDQLDQRYETMCDPRLNARQSLDLAFQVAELLRR